jgi:hypothetical protein
VLTAPTGTALFSLDSGGSESSAKHKGGRKQDTDYP